MNTLIRSFLALTIIALSLNSCIERVVKKDKLPIYGFKEEMRPKENGEMGLDSVLYPVDSFLVIDQDSNWITEKNFEGKIYVVDFFFTHCPTICPIMTKNMVTIHDEFINDPNVVFLSHSIDTKNDSVPQLKSYANKIGIESSKWHMVTADKKEIYRLAELYMVSADEDPNSPGGYMHSGAFILMDGKHRIRGYYDGTLTEDTEQIIADIYVLKKENEN